MIWKKEKNNVSRIYLSGNISYNYWSQKMWPPVQEIEDKKMSFELNIMQRKTTVCPGSSDPSEKILNIFASENEVYIAS